MSVRLAILALLGLPIAMQACDLCGCYTPQLETMSAAHNAEPGQGALHGFYVAVAEQFTRFATVQVDGREIDNVADQYLNSSITEFVVGYGVNDRIAIQFNLPVIYRAFRRPEGFGIDEGSVAGLGDIALLAKAVLWRYTSGGWREFQFQGKNPVAIEHEPDFATSLIALAGAKFPTGATDRLKEEFHEHEVPGAPKSGIHGHDLTLGSGSFDGIFGGEVALRYKRCFAVADAQFTWRSEGAHDYRFANDVTWRVGPGYYIVRRPELVVGCQCAVSGEHKGKDEFRGQPAEDTGITAVYVGPRIVASYEHLSGEIAAEFPVLIENTALQVVPDYRLRAGIALSW